VEILNIIFYYLMYLSYNCSPAPGEAEPDCDTDEEHELSGIKKRRPLTADEVRELDAYYKIGTTYTSNALEGNLLTLTETKVLLEDGITVGGKPVRDFYEAIGHAKAYDYMLSAARSDDMVFTEEMICKLHHLFYSGIDTEQAGKYRDRQVFITGTEYVAALVAAQREKSPTNEPFNSLIAECELEAQRGLWAHA